MTAGDARLFASLSAGLLLAGSWGAGVMVFSSAVQWPVRVALAAAVLPLIALLLGGTTSHRAIGALARRAPWIREVIALSTPMTLFWALNHPALGSWWIRDDPCHLGKILDYGAWQPFTSSIGYFLTPWLNLTLGTDFALFGLDARAFYAHQLVSFSLLVVAGYSFLRAYLSVAGSSLALSLFVVSVPSFAVARLLMNRHYLEGLILALASLALYRRSVEGGRFGLAMVGAAFYLLATTTKEVFVPVLLLLPFLTGGDPPRRWRHGLPFAVAAGIYGLWRLYMLGLGNSLSGYGALGGEFRLEALGRIPALLGLGSPWKIGLAVAVAVAAGVTLARRIPRARLAFVAGLVALGAPLIPVAARLEARHFFLPALVAAALLAAALEPPAARSRRAPLHALLRALAAVLLLLGALISLTDSFVWQRFEPAIVHHRSEGNFVLDDTRPGLLMTTVNHSTFLQCLARLRREVLAEPGGPGFCGDSCYCAGAFPGEPRWRYDAGKIVPAGEAAGTGHGNVPGCDAGRPLEVELAHDHGAKRMSWTFGPYLDGTYEVLLISGVETPGVSIPVPLPRQGSMPYWLSEPLRFVVKHRSPEGWQTYSRIYTVEPDGQATAEP